MPPVQQGFLNLAERSLRPLTDLDLTGKYDHLKEIVGHQIFALAAAVAVIVVPLVVLPTVLLEDLS